MHKFGISIVTGTYNRLPLLQRMIDSARAGITPTIPYEIIVVDGGSTDGTLEWLSLQNDVVLLEHGELRGAIKAFCDGAEAAQFDYVILANDDIQFLGDSIIIAMGYLDANHSCGAVAFADNRSGFGGKIENASPRQYATAKMIANCNDGRVMVPYAQVGMFRRWLGNALGWWGANDPIMSRARTYAGDNWLSCRIWESGYTVDEVEGVLVHDEVYDDELRALDKARPTVNGYHPDSALFYEAYPEGPIIPDNPLIASQDAQRLRILHLPIYEVGNVAQHEQKHGLRDALAERGMLIEIDYMAMPKAKLYERLRVLIAGVEPHLVLAQFHSSDVLTGPQLYSLRSYAPHAVWCNWNGDPWPHALIERNILEMLKWFDLQLVVNASALEVYEAEGIPAGYWQIGFEAQGAMHPNDLASAGYTYPERDVVMLANCNGWYAHRVHIENMLETMGVNYALYGEGWRNSAGVTLYDFRTGQAIYNASKLAISDTVKGAIGFVSNRVYQILAAGGAMMLLQEVPELERYTGLVDGVHYVGWRDLDDLGDKIDYYLSHEDERLRIAQAGTERARKHDTFDERVAQLFAELLPKAARRNTGYIPLKYIGINTSAFGVMNRKYICKPGIPMLVTEQDAEFLLARYPDVWARNDKS